MKKLLAIFACSSILWAAPDQQDSDQEFLLSMLIISGLTEGHFHGRPLDDDISIAAFDKYLKVLDQKKNLLISQDIKKLELYRKDIDDQASRGDLAIVDLAEQLIEQRIRQIQAYITERIEQPFDLAQKRTLQFDSEKISWAQDMEQLYHLWDTIIAQDIINNYLILEEGDKEQNLVRQAIQLTKEKYLGDFGFFKNLLKLKQDRNHQLGKLFNAITAVYDPHTYYFSPQKGKNFNTRISGSYYGVGIKMHQTFSGEIKIIDIIPGSPVWKAKKIQREDIILKVGQGTQEPINVQGMHINDVGPVITGKKGSEVQLTVKHQDGSIEVISIIRNKVVKEESYTKHSVLQREDSKEKFGYIKLPSFYRSMKSDDRGHNSTLDMMAAINQLKKLNVSGIILDLRNNPGGAIRDAEDISELFVDGPIYQKKDARHNRWVAGGDTPAIYSGPLVILVNKLSASAAEILASAMQDYKRAVIIGTQTYGKGTIQQFINFDQMITNLIHNNILEPKDVHGFSLGMIKLTVAKFYRVNGSSVQTLGVTPDIILPNATTFVQNMKKNDIDFSLSNDSVAALKFRPALHNLFLEELREKSKTRVEQNINFQRTIKAGQRLKAISEHTEQEISVQAIREKIAKIKASLMQLENNDIDESLIISNVSIDKILPPEHGEAWRKNMQKDIQLGEALEILKDLADHQLLEKNKILTP